MLPVHSSASGSSALSGTTLQHVSAPFGHVVWSISVPPPLPSVISRYNTAPFGHVTGPVIPPWYDDLSSSSEDDDPDDLVPYEELHPYTPTLDPFLSPSEDDEIFGQESDDELEEVLPSPELTVPSDVSLQGDDCSRGRKASDRSTYLLGRLAKSRIVREFGKELDLSDEHDAQTYLVYLDEWFRGLNHPHDYDHFVDFSRSWGSKRHRALALALLAHHNTVAWYCNRALLSKLTKHQFESWAAVDFAEKQGRSAWWIAGGAALVAVVSGLITYSAVKTVNKVAPLTSALNAVGSIATAVSDAAQTVLSWIQQLYAALIQTLEHHQDFVVLLMSKFALTAAVFLGIRYASSWFPSQAENIRSVVFHSHNFVEKQGKTYESPGHETVDFFREYFLNVPSDAFWYSVGTLPKLTNFARSIEYVFTNMKKLYVAAQEALTGVPSPRNAFETSVVEFDASVREALIIVHSGVSKDILDLEVTLASLESIRDNLTYKCSHESDLRPFITNLFASARHGLDTVRRTFNRVQTSAQPRPTTVWLALWGAAGTRKTTLVRGICQDAKAYLIRENYPGLEGPLQDHDIHVWDPSEPYWDHYGGAPFTVHDDLFQCESTQDRNPDARRIISMISPFPMSLPVADMNIKGKIFFNSIALITTANIHDFYTANLGLADPSALDSRRTLDVQIVDSTPGAEKFLLDETQVLLAGLHHANQRTLTYDELVGIFAECILTRRAEFTVPRTVRDVPRYDRGFIGGRIFVPPGGTTVTSSDYPPQPTRSLVSVHSDRVPKKGHKLGRAYRAPRTCSPAILSDPSSSKQGKDKGKEKVRENDSLSLPTKVLHPNLVAKLSGVALSRPLPGFPLYEDGLRVAEEKMFAHLVPTAAFDKLYSAAPCRFSPFLPREEYWKIAHSFDPDSGISVTAHMYAGYLDYATSRSPYSPYYQALGYDIVMSEEDFVTHYHEVQSKYSLTPIIMAAFAGMAIITGGTFLLLRTVLTSALPSEELQAYDNDPKARKPVKKPYVKSPKRPNKRIEEVLGTVQGHVNSYHHISRNYDRVTLYLSPSVVSNTEALNLTPTCTSWCLCIGSTRYAIPLHVLLEKGSASDVRYVGLKTACTARFNLKELKYLGTWGGDVGIFEFPSVLPQRPDLVARHHFEESDFSHGRLIQIRPEENSSGYSVISAVSWDNELRVIPATDSYPEIYTNFRIEGIPNEVGMCGIVYVNSITGKIVAMHMAGNHRSTSYAVNFTHEDVYPYAPQTPPTFLDPLKVELIETQGISGVQVLGRLPDKYAAYVNTKTRLCESHFDFPSFPIPPTTDAPAMLNKTGDISPLRNSVAKLSQQCVSGAPPDCPSLDPQDFLPPDFNRQAAGKSLSLLDAIYGIPGYIDGIDMQKSLGYIYKRLGFKTRRQIFPGREASSPIHPLVHFDLENALDDIRNGKPIAAGIIEENLKDEIRDHERVKAGKTRLFAVYDLRTFIITKVFFGCFFAELEKDPTSGPSTIGINPHSSDWGIIFSQLKGAALEARLPRDGDFGSYDISHKEDGERAFTELVCSFHCEPDCIIVVVALNLHGSWHIIGVVVFLRPWGMSSGSFLTSVFNTFVNWFYHGKAWYNLFPDVPYSTAVGKFHGDDSLVAVPPQYAAFDCAYLTKFFRETYQMDYTSSDKGVAREKDWSEIQFLKRRFVPGKLGIMAPLATASIANMVRWTCDPGDSVVMTSVCRSVLDETFHHGPELYSSVSRWVRQESIRLNLPVTVPSFAQAALVKAKDYMR